MLPARPSTPAIAQLEPGRTYSWDFIFEIPHESAPYERSRHGKLYQKITAKLTLHSGGGLLSSKKTLSCSKNVFFVALPTGDGSLQYDFSHRDVQEHLGPLLVVTRSQHLTVGGYIRTALSLPSPAPDLILTHASLTLVQKITLTSRKRSDLVTACPVESFTVMVSDGEDIKREESLASSSDEEESGEDDETGTGKRRGRRTNVSFEGSWVNKLPNDNLVRPSSLPGSDSAIKLSHEFDFVLRYTFPRCLELTGKPELVYRATWGVSLPSCAARYESVRLPNYTLHDAMPVPELSRDEFAGPNEHESHSHCACGDALTKLMRVEDEAHRLQSHRLADDIRHDMVLMRLANSRSSSRSQSRVQSRSVSRSVSRRPSLDRAASSSGAGAGAGGGHAHAPIPEDDQPPPDFSSASTAGGGFATPAALDAHSHLPNGGSGSGSGSGSHHYHAAAAAAAQQLRSRSAHSSFAMGGSGSGSGNNSGAASPEQQQQQQQRGRSAGTRSISILRQGLSASPSPSSSGPCAPPSPISPSQPLAFQLPHHAQGTDGITQSARELRARMEADAEEMRKRRAKEAQLYEVRPPDYI